MASQEPSPENKIDRATLNMLNDIVAEHSVVINKLPELLQAAVVAGSKAAVENVLSDEKLMDKYWAGAFLQFRTKATNLGKDTLWAVLWGGVKRIFLIFCLFLFIGNYFSWPLATTIAKSFFFKE